MKIQLAIAAAAGLLISARPAAAQSCDANATSRAYAPAKDNFGMVLFEDRWPLDGDLDFNDQVFAYNFVFNENQAGAVSSLQLSVDVLAVGAHLENALYFHLPVPSGAASSITISGSDGVQRSLTPVGGQPDLVLLLSADTRTDFPGQPEFINTAPATAPLPATRLNLVVQFRSPVALQPAAAPYDLYIERVAEAGHQIHRPMYAGTSTMNTALFGTGNDGSTASVHFVNERGLPFALTVPQLISWPAEGTVIDSVYPDISLFASSGGTQSTSWYTSSVVPAHTWQGLDPSNQSAPAIIGPNLLGVCAAVSATYHAGAGPRGIAIDASGNAWVTNSNDNTVVRLSSNGVNNGTFYGFNSPFGIAIAPTGNIWVTNFSGGTTTRISAAGDVGSAYPSGFQSCFLAIDSSGIIWVSDYNGSSVTRLSPTGQFLTSTPASLPQFIKFDSAGNAWVGAQFTPLIEEIGPSGNVLRTINTGAAFPSAIGFDLAGNLWVTDANSTDVLVFNPNTGVHLATYPTGGSGPYSLVFDAHGNPWIGNINSNNVVHLCGSAACGTVGAILGTYPVGVAPDDITIDAAGNVWTSNAGDGTVTKLIGAVH